MDFRDKISSVGVSRAAKTSKRRTEADWILCVAGLGGVLKDIAKTKSKATDKWMCAVVSAFPPFASSNSDTSARRGICTFGVARRAVPLR
jgi:hypothetical protein